MNPYDLPTDVYRMRQAVMAMVDRYGDSERAAAYANDDSGRERAYRAAGIRYRAIQRLTLSLAAMTGGTR